VSHVWNTQVVWKPNRDGWLRGSKGRLSRGGGWNGFVWMKSLKRSKQICPIHMGQTRLLPIHLDRASTLACSTRGETLIPRRLSDLDGLLPSPYSNRSLHSRGFRSYPYQKVKNNNNARVNKPIGWPML
jgi:hypothetical protein